MSENEKMKEIVCQTVDEYKQQLLKYAATSENVYVYNDNGARMRGMIFQLEDECVWVKVSDVA